MTATMPVGVAARLAGVQTPPDVTLSGTVMNGMASLRGYQARWQLQVRASLAARAWVMDVRLTGPQTDLVGKVVLRPARAEIAPLTGRAGWSLVDALMPGLDIRCETVAVLDVAHIAIGSGLRRAAGQIGIGAGTCERVDGTVTAVPLPALDADLATTDEGIRLGIVAVNAPDIPLGNLVLTTDDRLRITVHPAGAAMVPGLPVGGDSQVELPLALFTQ